MTVPYNTDTRESYVSRRAQNHLDIAESLYWVGNCEHSMWVQLFTWAQAEEIYGEHWDKIMEEMK